MTKQEKKQQKTMCDYINDLDYIIARLERKIFKTTELWDEIIGKEIEEDYKPRMAVELCIGTPWFWEDEFDDMDKTVADAIDHIKARHNHINKLLLKSNQMSKPIEKTKKEEIYIAFDYMDKWANPDLFAGWEDEDEDEDEDDEQFLLAKAALKAFASMKVKEEGDK